MASRKRRREEIARMRKEYDPMLSGPIALSIGERLNEYWDKTEHLANSFASKGQKQEQPEEGDLHATGSI